MLIKPAVIVPDVNVGVVPDVNTEQAAITISLLNPGVIVPAVVVVPVVLFEIETSTYAQTIRRAV